MSATSFLTVMLMLALVLGAMGVAFKLLRRYAVTGASAKGGVKMQIIQRLTLGQRQGLAVVRIGSRVFAVSMGDGGVHPVAELDESDFALATDAVREGSAAPIATITGGLRKLALLRTDSSDRAQTGAEQPARISYVAPKEDFDAVLAMAMGGGARA